MLYFSPLNSSSFTSFPPLPPIPLLPLPFVAFLSHPSFLICLYFVVLRIPLGVFNALVFFFFPFDVHLFSLFPSLFFSLRLLICIPLIILLRLSILFLFFSFSFTRPINFFFSPLTSLFLLFISLYRIPPYHSSTFLSLSVHPLYSSPLPMLFKTFPRNISSSFMLSRVFRFLFPPFHHSLITRCNLFPLFLLRCSFYLIPSVLFHFLSSWFPSSLRALLYDSSSHFLFS